MLNKQQMAKLEPIFDQHGLSERTRKLVRRICTTEPTRTVRSGRRNVPTRFPSRKMGCIIQAESHRNELATLYLWEHDPDVYAFLDQPETPRLSYKRGDRTVNTQHTADYFLIARDFIGWVECKTEADLLEYAETDSELFRQEGDKWICPPGIEAAADWGLGYRVRASSENNPILVRNLQFLSAYLEAEFDVPSDGELASVRRLFERQAWMPLHELLDNAEGLNADDIYRLICQGVIYFDLDARPLCDEFAKIFRNREAYEVFLQDSRTEPSSAPILSVDLKVGAIVNWEERHWKVVAFAEHGVDLLDAQGELRTLNHQAINAMVASGRLTGVETGLAAEAALERERRMRRASEPELGEATLRLRMMRNNDSAPISRCRRTLRNYERRFEEADELYDNGFIGLLPRYEKRGNRTQRFPDQVYALFDAQLASVKERGVALTVTQLHADFVKKCNTEGLPHPCAKTYRAMRKARINAHALTLHFEGHRAAYATEEQVWLTDNAIPPHGDYPFDIAHIDHTQLDLMLVDKNIKDEVCRPWLSFMIDGYSRKVLASYLSYDRPNYVTCMMLIRRCVQLHGRLPRSIVVDGGKEFHSDYFERLLAMFAVEKKMRPAARPRFGSIMERLFGVTNQQLIHGLLGNTRPLRNVRQCTSTHDPRRLAVWTLDRADQLIEDWLEQAYHCAPHGGIHAIPNEVFDAGLREFGQRVSTRIAYTESVCLLVCDEH